MPWQDLLRPRFTHPGPITDLDVGFLRSQGIRGIVLDVDDTLVPAHCAAAAVLVTALAAVAVAGLLLVPASLT